MDPLLIAELLSTALASGVAGYWLGLRRAKVVEVTLPPLTLVPYEGARRPWNDGHPHEYAHNVRGKWMCHHCGKHRTVEEDD